MDKIDEPKKPAGVVMLPGVALSPGACLGQILEDIDEVEHLMVVIQWKDDAGFSVRHSVMNPQEGIVAQFVLQRFVTAWLERCVS